MARLTEELPLVLFIDDVHWGDADSAALLADLMRPPDAPPLLLIITYRGEETETSPLLRRLLPERLGSSWNEVAVDRLGTVECRELARALLTGSSGEDDAAAESIARESGGNPFFLSELARSIGSGADVTASRTDGAAEGRVTLDGVIRQRVSRLPAAARRLLEIVALAGRPVAFSVAREAAEIESRENVLEVLRTGHLIRTRGTAGREEIESYHDRVREAVAAALSPAILKSHHRRLAVALEASGHADPESLALHWKEAGDHERAAEYAAEAAQQASETLAFDRAGRLYSLALDLASGADTQALRHLRVKLGDALANAGRGADAASSYLIAADDASTAEALELRRRAAEQLLRSGRIDQGLPVLRGVLARVGFRYAETSVGSLLSFLFHRLRIRLRGLQFHERDSSQIAPEQLIRIDTCWSVSLGLGMIDTIRGRDFQARHLLLALKAGEPYRVARALANEAGYSAVQGRSSSARTADLVKAATALAERVGQPKALGVAQVAVGITAYLEGRWKTAWDLAKQGETILRERCTGVAWELDTTHIYSLRALFYLGEIAELSARLPVLLQEAAERDDLFAATSLRTRHGYIAHLAADDMEKARREVHDAINGWSAQAFHLQHFFSLIGECDIALYAGEPEVAEDLLVERQRALKLSRLLQVQVFRTEWLHVRGRSSIALAVVGAPPQSAAWLRAAERYARAIDRERVHWGDPLANLLRAGAASVRGDGKGAIGLLAAAETAFEAADMAFYAAVARRRRGELLGDTEGRALVDAADIAMRNQKIRNPARIAAMLAPGKWSCETDR